MKITAPAKGGATQGPMIKADKKPMITVPIIPDPCALSLTELILLCHLEGNCISKYPKSEIAKAKNITAKPVSTHGFCKAD